MYHLTTRHPPSSSTDTEIKTLGGGQRSTARLGRAVAWDGRAENIFPATAAIFWRQQRRVVRSDEMSEDLARLC